MIEKIRQNPGIAFLLLISMMFLIIICLQLFIIFRLPSVFSISTTVPLTFTPVLTTVTATSAAQLPVAPCPEGMAYVAAENFCIDVYEVTNAHHQECVAAGECTEPDNTTSVRRQHEVYYGNPAYNDYPVIRVTWDQANKYCQFVGKRLPTAAEWDQAADYAWPSHDEITKYSDTQEVGSIKDVSNEGVHDLAGNVREWVADSHGISKILKGMSFFFTPGEAEHRLPNTVDWATGFRCASDAP